MTLPVIINSGQSTSGFSSGTFSIPFNFPSGHTNTYLLGFVAVQGADDITSANRNGVAMTFLKRIDFSDVSVEAWGMTAPATGNLNVNFLKPNSPYGFASLFALSGVHQSSPIDTDTSATGASSPLVLNFNTNYNDSILLSCFAAWYSSGGPPPTAGSVGSGEADQHSGAFYSNLAGGSQSKAAATAGAQTMQRAFSGFTKIAGVGIALRDVNAAGGGGGGPSNAVKSSGLWVL